MNLHFLSLVNPALYAPTLAEKQAQIGHVVAILEANRDQRPYSDLALRCTHHAHNLPSVSPALIAACTDFMAARAKVNGGAR